MAEQLTFIFSAYGSMTALSLGYRSIPLLCFLYLLTAHATTITIRSPPLYRRRHEKAFTTDRMGSSLKYD